MAKALQRIKEKDTTSLRDKDPLEDCLTTDSRTVVFEWLAFNPQNKEDIKEYHNYETRLEDLLDSLLEDQAHGPMKIRIRP